MNLRYSTAETFVRKCEEAIKGRQEHVEAFIEFDAALPVESTVAWTKLCQTWEADRSQKNPFEKGNTGMYLILPMFFNE